MQKTGMMEIGTQSAERESEEALRAKRSYSNDKSIVRYIDHISTVAQKKAQC